MSRTFYQEYQFDCAREMVGGMPNAQNIWNIPPDQIHLDIADWALVGGVLCKYIKFCKGVSYELR